MPHSPGIQTKSFVVNYGTGEKNIEVQRKYYNSRGQNQFRIVLQKPLINSIKPGITETRVLSVIVFVMKSGVVEEIPEYFDINIESERVMANGYTFLTGVWIEQHTEQDSIKPIIVEISNSIRRVVDNSDPAGQN